MENASKALIMAAGVLIGMLVLSLAVYLFVSFGSSSAQISKQNDENQINQFNSQFTSYVGKSGITIYDVVSVANKATENNIYYDFPKSNATKEDTYISVILKNDRYNNISIEDGNDNKNNILNEIISNEPIDTDTKELPQYTCEVKISDITKRVYKVKFEQIIN